MSRKAILALTAMAFLLFTGCTADERLDGTAYFEGIDAEQGNVVKLTSDNAVIQVITGGNVTAATLILTSLPAADPGVPGAVWSDNGTLRISK